MRVTGVVWSAVGGQWHAAPFQANCDLTMPAALGHRLDEMDVVVFDLETTGLSPYSEEIIQIAAVRMRGGRILSEEAFDTFVNPGRRISSFITNYTGISNSHVQGAPDPGEALARFSAYVGDALLIAHNGQRFDMPFMYRACAAAGGMSGRFCGFDEVLPAALGWTRWTWIGRGDDAVAAECWGCPAP